ADGSLRSSSASYRGVIASAADSATQTGGVNMKQLIAVLIAGVAWAVFAPHVQAGECLRDAKSTFTDCKVSCKSDLLEGRSSWANVSTGCFLACRDGKLECINDVEQPLNDCIATCNGPLDAGRASCQSTCGCGTADNRCGFNECYVHCVDPYQSTAFSC